MPPIPSCPCSCRVLPVLSACVDIVLHPANPLAIHKIILAILDDL